MFFKCIDEKKKNTGMIDLLTFIWTGNPFWKSWVEYLPQARFLLTVLISKRLTTHETASQDESFREEIKHLFNFQIVSLLARPSVISAAQKQQQQQQNDWLKCCTAPMLILGPDTNAPHTITDGQLGALPHFFFFLFWQRL